MYCHEPPERSTALRCFTDSSFMRFLPNAF